MTGEVTTIKVPRQLRDRVAQLARHRRATMADVLDEAVGRLEQDVFFARMRDQLVRLHDEDPREWESYRSEATEWEQATIADGLGQGDNA